MSSRNRELWGLAVTALAVAAGLFVLWLNREVLELTGDAIYVTLFLGPILIFAMATGRLKELRGPGGLGASFIQPAIEQATRRPNEVVGAAFLHPSSMDIQLLPIQAEQPIAQLSSSANDQIAAAIYGLSGQPSAGPVLVNLGSGRSWFSTRVYLLAALLDDFTEVEHILFLGDDARRRFIGLATPRSVWQAMASLHPDIEGHYRRSVAQAYENSLVRPADILMLMGHFVQTAFGPAGGLAEAERQHWVTPALLETRLSAGLQRSAIELGPDEPWAPRIVRRITLESQPIVPLLRQGELLQLVDRCELVTSLARGVQMQD